MSERRSYGQYCAVAMALDRIGDRWTPLILRDLLGGPARFVDLAHGLPGIGTNLLTERLRSLEQDGVVERTVNEHNVALYSLTPLGEATRPILEELGMWGQRLSAPQTSRRPESFRGLAVGLQSVLSAGLPASDSARVDLDVEGQHLDIAVEPERVDVVYRRPPEADAHLRTEYAVLSGLLIEEVEPTAISKAFELTEGDASSASVVTDILATALSRGA